MSDYKLATVTVLPVGKLIEFPFWRTAAYRRIVRTAKRLQRTAATLLGCAALTTALAVGVSADQAPTGPARTGFVFPCSEPPTTMVDRVVIVSSRGCQ